VSLQAQQEVIAITDVDAEGLSNFDIKRFVNKLESELVSLGTYEVTSRQKVEKPLSAYVGDGLIFYLNYPQITFNNSTFEQNLDDGVIRPAGGYGFGFEYRERSQLVGFNTSSAYLELEGFGLDSTTMAFFYSADVYYMYSPYWIDASTIKMLPSTVKIIPSIGFGFQESSIEIYLDNTSSIITSRPFYLIDLRIDLMNILDASWGIGATYKKSFSSSYLAAQLTYPEKDRDWSQSNIYVHFLGEWAFVPCYFILVLIGVGLGG